MENFTLKKNTLLISFAFLLISVFTTAQTTTTYNSSSTYTVPIGVTSITVEVWGGGGKGGTRTTNGGGAGGGGGAYARKKITVTAGSTYTVRVGTGSTTATAAGGDSWFNNATTILAKGGNSVLDNGTTGATGGTAASCIGDFVLSGGQGSDAISAKSGGGGGSSAGNTLAGVNSTNASGAIAPTNGGNGGNAKSIGNGTGTVGTAPGGGGGGAFKISGSTTYAGGNGASGRVVITSGAQEIDILGNDISIATGDTSPSGLDGTDFNTIDISSGVIYKNFTISNLGSNNLTISSITVTGATDFTITSAPTLPATIGGRDNSIFTITFNPTSIGTKTATITIANNDSNESSYTFTVKGEGIQTFYDSDGDGIYDNIDIDDDNDGIVDVVEESNCRGVNGYNVNYKFLNETFGTGSRTTINTTYAATTSYLYENAGDLNDGEYTVGSSAQIASWASTYWYQGTDHTGDTNGRMAMFNADYTPGVFYTALITGALSNIPITYSFWVLNLDRSDAPGIATRLRPNIRVEFRDLNDNLITSISTGEIAPTNTANATGDWYNFKADLVLNVSAFKVIFINNETGGQGNDLAIDDIVITQTLCDRDSDGIADLFDLDSDNDGIEDIIEVGLGNLSNGKGKISVPWVDANGNGLHDSAESIMTATLLDSDGDGIPNYIDLDSDNDSIFDIDESGAGNIHATDSGFVNGDGDINGDGVGDGPETETFRNKDTNGDGITEGFGDGILDIFDYGTGMNQYGNLDQGTATANPATTYLRDTDGDGIPDYLDLKSNGTTWDIAPNLLLYDYKILDANNDGIIDGTADIDKDGILDLFDTNTAQFGSPRDIHTKLFLDFDGRNDYAQSTAILGGLSNATLMAWIDLNAAFSGDAVIVGQNKFQLRINSSRKLEATVNGSKLTFTTAVLPFTSSTLSTSQWYHVAAVFDGSNAVLKLYLNGTMVASKSVASAITSDTSLLTIGRDPATVGPTGTNYFKGKIDELRVFNVALTDSQLQRMVYQEIQDSGSGIGGVTVPKNIATAPANLPFTNLLRYYRMDVYKDDIIDDLTTPTVDITGTKIYNHKIIASQQAPMPFLTERVGSFSVAVDSPTKEIRGIDIMENDWSIVKVQHDITETANNIDLGMLVNTGVTINMTNNTKLQNDWYLKLDGKVDLVGKSQLVQTTESDLDVTSAGAIERDQQGQSNKFNYNYWSSPVSPVNTLVNNKDYTINSVMKDGTTTTPQNINWIGGYDGNPSAPISLARFWIYKFDNYANAYANWVAVNENGTIRVGQGYTLKGSGAATATQNYTFVGKPNNGTIATNSISTDQLLLAGNPYPSALDADQFLTDNLGVTDGTLYFWEHYDTNNTHVLRDYQGGYAIRNLVGGIPATSVGVEFVSGLGSSSKGAPNQFVPVGQSFFLNGNASAGGTIVYKNSQRGFHKEDEATVSNVLFKAAATKKEAYWNNNNNDALPKNTYQKIRLGYQYKTDHHRQVLLGFMDDKATSEMDYGYDGLNFDDYPSDMYFLNGANKLVIQGEGYFNIGASYTIGVKNDSPGKVRFMIDQLENFDTNQKIFIYDNNDDSYHDIRSASYEIELLAGEFNNRFSLRFKDNTVATTPDTTTTPDRDNDGDRDERIKVHFLQKRNLIQISNSTTNVTIEKVVLYNLYGQIVQSWKIENQKEELIQLNVKRACTGLYFIKVLTSKGPLFKKVMIKQ
ncbi:LamG-like jellyroll fold domain-containing protein [Flavobacterium muglaense]|uniref:Choice-of-anchor D domain-containing protein n=1 Tax=Flavobacterium muglaense TaxID=2764716 RepID=A0A923SEV8_9FLAO|nr:LamG-like jellyroll fold domain-containing protein [Flavobacterium muglaense]MBC5837256.1 choice-of-anchor D domain-containing protein [Flavobacterium muglaense]MBC5843820.1 choice-of-anchor D domain-containing protein [Flavobacterium muglaense]